MVEDEALRKRSQRRAGALKRGIVDESAGAASFLSRVHVLHVRLWKKLSAMHIESPSDIPSSSAHVRTRAHHGLSRERACAKFVFVPSRWGEPLLSRQPQGHSGRTAP